MPFRSLGLRAELVRAVSEEGYDQPTPVQRESIPLILERRDVLAGAQTGTGKTAGFALPILQLLMATHRPSTGREPQRGPRGFRPIRTLILTPTRELAGQVEESIQTYGRHLPIRSTPIYGGVGFGNQIAILRRGVDIVVATPGRLLDHVNQRTIDLSRVEILVLDEADRMLDMGFIPDIRKILALLPAERQNLLFSATFSDEIRELADGFLRNPAQVQVAARNAPSELVAHIVHPVDKNRKRKLLAHLIDGGSWQQVLVFTRTKHGADRLAEQLETDGIAATAIHGNKSQGARTKALRDFKRGAARVLVATDIAARGLDIDQLPHVVNYELPHVPEDYVHRIGRTGRAGNEGTAVSLVCADEHSLLHGIERLLKRDLPRQTIVGYEPDPSIRPEPILRARGGHGGGQKSGPRPGASGYSGHSGMAPRRSTRLAEPWRPEGADRREEPAGDSPGNRRYEGGPRPSRFGGKPGEHRRPGGGSRSSGGSRSGAGSRYDRPERQTESTGGARADSRDRQPYQDAPRAATGRSPRKTRSSTSRPRPARTF